DGVQTFALPDLRGRTAVGAGQGNGLSYYSLGQNGGTNNVTLLPSNLPPHNHPATGTVTIPAYSDEGNADTPAGHILAAKTSMYSSEAGDTNLKPASYSITLGVSGGSQPLNITQPSLGMNYVICMY